MANKTWKELLELYLIGSLSEQDRALFDQYLAGNAAYRREVDEWQQIARVVRMDAEARVDQLPPLRLPGVYIPVQSLNGSHSHRKKERVNMQKIMTWENEKRNHLPVTALVAAMTVVLLGGLLLFSNRGGDNNPLLSGFQQPASATPLPTATPVATMVATATPFPTLVPTSTPTAWDSDGRMLTGSPSAVTAMPPTVPPPMNEGVQPLTFTPSPVPFAGGNQSADPRLTITPSRLEPIISNPARLVVSTRLAIGDSAQAIDWAGDAVVVAGFSGVWLYDASQLDGATRLLPDDTAPGLVSTVFSPDGTLVATLNWDRMLRVWDVASGAKLAEMANAPLWGDLLFMPDSTGIYSTLDSGLVRLDFATVTVTAESLPTSINGYFRYSPDGETAVILTEQSLLVVHAESGDLLSEYDGVVDGVARILTFNADGSLLAVGTTDGTVYIYDLVEGAVIRQLDGEGLVMGLDFNSDGDKLAIVRNAWELNSLWLYDFSTQAELPLVVYDISLVGPVFGDNGQQLLVSSDDGRLILLDLSE